MSAVKTSFFCPKDVRFENLNRDGPLTQTEQLTDACSLIDFLVGDIFVFTFGNLRDNTEYTY